MCCCTTLYLPWTLLYPKICEQLCMLSFTSAALMSEHGSFASHNLVRSLRTRNNTWHGHQLDYLFLFSWKLDNISHDFKNPKVRSETLQVDDAGKIHVWRSEWWIAARGCFLGSTVVVVVVIPKRFVFSPCTALIGEFYPFVIIFVRQCNQIKGKRTPKGK